MSSNERNVNSRLTPSFSIHLLCLASPVSCPIRHYEYPFRREDGGMHKTGKKHGRAAMVYTPTAAERQISDIRSEPVCRRVVLVISYI